MLTEHSHPHEQVANIIEGELKLTVNGDTEVLGPGSVAIIPPGAIHSGRAITHCRVIDVFILSGKIINNGTIQPSHVLGSPLHAAFWQT
jgi:quercetin dioxygenase-like cupin family protein